MIVSQKVVFEEYFISFCEYTLPILHRLGIDSWPSQRKTRRTVVNMVSIDLQLTTIYLVRMCTCRHHLSTSLMQSFSGSNRKSITNSTTARALLENIAGTIERRVERGIRGGRRGGWGEYLP